MNRTCSFLLALAFIPFADVQAAPDSAPASQPVRTTDTTGWYQWNFDLKDPDMGLIDLSHLLEAPAGTHGFVQPTQDGHMQFEDGTPVRFFGTSFGQVNTTPDKKIAEITAKRLARFGVNLVRFHCPDARSSPFIDYEKGTSQELDPDALDRYDYFFSELKKNGIYVYFDLLTYREFQPGDGVRDAEKMESHWVNSMKGASMFDPRMIELQKDYATKLLTHKNPYTGLRYADDPALAIVEITNENSLFYLHFGGLLLPPYWEDVRRLWNQWLVKQYGPREQLKQAWTNSQGVCALKDEEDPEAGTVAFPNKNLYDDLREEPYDGDKSPARMNSITRFLYETQVAYYETMIAHLKSLDVKCLITGTNQDFSDASNAANAVAPLMTRNNYWCLASAKKPNTVFFANKPMVLCDLTKQSNPVANVASSSVAGKPMFMPEMNFPWPNEFRTECLPIMASYARLQDWDGFLYFNYEAGTEMLSTYPNGSDPVRWSHVPLAAMVILRGDIAAARNTIHVGVSETDLMATRRQRTGDHYSLYRVLPFISKLRTSYFHDAYEGEADVAISSGHSAVGDYGAAKHAFVFADSAAVDELQKENDRGLSARQTVEGLITVPAPGAYDTTLERETIPAGADVFEKNGQAVGFIDDRRIIFPCATAQENEDPAWLHRMYLEAAKKWNLPSAASPDEAGALYRSDTGELVFDSKNGVFSAEAPRVAMVVGFFSPSVKVGLESLTVDCRTRFASFSAVALDDEPLESSRKILLTAAARAENTGQVYAVQQAESLKGPITHGDMDADTGKLFIEGRSLLVNRGELPILVEPVDATVTIASVHNLKAHTLTPKGQKDRELAVERAGGRLRFSTVDAHSPWILLSAEE